ncbi:alpha/beta hydrolase [Aporhodopirellula aestuarii]|uniref:Esterase n=1 Tax=Aporhodopirellula aestuarii TaxID=2950107 RepID=A0ABT0U7D4_9BACT|nr:esterase [Aporhodopirellula aestuarii]MCM2372839.1 esterase [Aporhodopirellula aestuarii]
MRYLTLLLLSAAIGCSESTRDLTDAIAETSRVTVGRDADDPWGGLKVQAVGTPLEDAAQIVVLLHGYGATESDLVPLADYIGGESRAFVFPAAPIAVDGGGLAWATTEDELAIAHAKLASLVRFISKIYPNAEVAVGGFSQGATVSSMLLLDRTLPIRHLILYSPALAIDAASIDSAHGIQVLLAHGQRDDVLPFADSKRLHEMLVREGIQTNWLPFDDGHTITTELLDATRDQLSQESK